MRVYDLYICGVDDVAPWPAGGWLHIGGATLRRYLMAMRDLNVGTLNVRLAFLTRDSHVTKRECKRIVHDWDVSGRLWPKTVEHTEWSRFMLFLEDAAKADGIDVT